MLVLGLVIVAAAVVFCVAVLTSNTDAVDMDLWGMDISDLSLGAIFAAGLVTTAVALLGIVMVLTGMRRGQRMRKERRELVRENRRLTRRIEDEPRAAPTATDASGRHTTQDATGEDGDSSASDGPHWERSSQSP